MLILMGLAGVGGCRATPTPFYQEDISPDGRILASPEGAEVRLRRPETDATVRMLSGGHAAPVLAVHFNPANDRLVSGDSAGTIVIWNPADGEKLGVLSGHRGAVRQFAVRARVPDLASGSDDGTVKLWDVNAAREIRTLSGHLGPVHGLAFSPDGDTLASASADGSVRLWDVAGGREIRTLGGGGPAVRAVDFDGSGTLLAAGGDDGRIRVWNAKTGEELRSMIGSKGPVLNLFMTRNGRWILAYQSFRDPSSQEPTAPISIWDVRSGELEVGDYLFESKVAPPDWPFRAIYQEIANRAAHRSP
jgi:WD40 repeat protein